jgi:uncharacterized tellurite resistance protein B-like protein
MNLKRNFHLGLLYLIHLLIGVDGSIDEREQSHLNTVRQKENIPDQEFLEFEREIRNKREKEVYQLGLDHINQCQDEDKLKAFVYLYKMTEVDGHVHVKEVRLLLYSTKMAGVEFEDVVARAKSV